MKTSDDSAVSPVVASILVVAITVALAVGIFVFVMDTTDNTSPSVTSYSSFSSNGDTYSSMVSDAGTAETLTYRVNGEPLVTIESPDEHVGESIDLTRYSQFCAGDEVTVIGGIDGSGTLLQTDVVEEDVNCNLSETSATSQATYDGESWIVNTTIWNRATDDREYIIVLTDGESYEVLESDTVSGDETAVITGSSTQFDADDDVTVGVISPSSGSGSGSGATLASTGGDAYGWSGGPSAGHSFYTPYSPTTSYSDSTSSSSESVAGESTLAATTESETSPDETEESAGLALSTTRVAPGDTVNLYATLATTKETADETLVVYATRTNPTTEEKARSTYELTAGEQRNVTESFSIDEPGEYVITASLVGDDEIHTAGTLTVVGAMGVSIESADVSATEIDAGEMVTLTSTVANDGASEATVDVEFFRDAESEALHEVTVGAGESTTVEETVTLPDLGTYQFHVGLPETAAIEEVGSVTVEDPSAVDVTATASPETARVGEAIEFVAEPEESESESIDQYEWDFDGDGTTDATGATVTHHFETEATHSVTVTATTDGHASTDTVSVTTVASYVQISNPTSYDLSEYQVAVNLDYQAEMQEDFADIRFKQDGETLPYWIESKTDGESATVWVRVNHIPADGSTYVELDYGADSATSQSDARATMEVYDFHNNNGYSGTNLAGASVMNGGEYLELTDASDDQENHAAYGATPAPGFYAEYDWYIGGGTGADSLNLHAWSDGTYRYHEASNGHGLHWMLNDHDSCLGITYSEANDADGQCGDVESVTGEDPAQSSWKSATAWGVRDGTSVAYYYDVLGYTMSGTYTHSSIPDGNKFGFGGRTGGSNNHHWVKNVTIRKYAGDTMETSIQYK